MRKKAPLLRLWLSLFILNIIVIAPSFMLPRERLSLGQMLAHGGHTFWQKVVVLLSFIRQQNYLWLSIDLLLFVTLLYLLLEWRHVRKALIVFSGVFSALFLYEIYEVIIIRFFTRPPVLDNDALLFIDGLNLMTDLASQLWWLYVLVVVVFLLLTVYLVPMLFRNLEPGLRFLRLRYCRQSLIALALLWVAVILLYGHDNRMKDREGLAQCTIARVANNVQASLILRDRLNQAISQPRDTTYQTYNQLHLREKPDVYLFLVESYGKVLAERSDFRPFYREVLRSMQSALSGQGWSMMTNYSEAPVRGGGSWMSIATVLGGIHLDNQAVWVRYITQVHPNFATFFHQQGYYTVSLQPNTRQRPGRPLRNQFAFDRMFLYDDMNYRGPAYGWGVIPDQYSLYYTSEQLKEVRSPLFLFFMTITPHLPWSDLPPLVDDWRSLNIAGNSALPDAPDFQKLKKRIDREMPPDSKESRYLKIIFYDLLVLQKFILERVQDNSIVLLIGDHQPSLVADRSHDAQTPVHVICKDRQYLATLKSFGFVNGCYKNPRDEDVIKHEAMFPLVVRTLAERWGENVTETFPQYKADGASLSIIR